MSKIKKLVAVTTDDINKTILFNYNSTTNEVSLNGKTLVELITGLIETNQAFRNFLINTLSSGSNLSPSGLPTPSGDIPSGEPLPNGDISSVDENTPLTFKAIGDSSIGLSKYGSPDAITLNYKKNDEEWTEYTIGSLIFLNDGLTIAFSGVNDHFSNYTTRYYKFGMNGIFEAYGNIQSLMNFSNSCTTNCYRYLFNNCSSLIKAPDLYATSMAEYCYDNMFAGCINLVTPPSSLPISYMANYCCEEMFRNCTALTAAPELPATKMATYCYRLMFDGCSSLAIAPSLPATTLGWYCYLQMFRGCTSLTSVFLPATSLADTCYGEMFNGCSSLSSIEVNFTNWGTTSNWVSGVAANGRFIKPAGLSETRGVSNIPEGWVVLNK